MDVPSIIAVDIGGTSFRVALIDGRGDILARNVKPTRALEGSQRGIQRLKETIKATVGSESFTSIRGIAVGSAGPIDPELGMILTPPSLPTWHYVPVKAQLEDEFQVPVWVESDADFAALGEHRFGSGRGLERLVYVTVSTGIGGGIIIGGQLLRGTKVSIAEVGHMVVDPNGPVCNCGGRGHLEALASGTAIAHIAVGRILRGEGSSITTMVGGDVSKVKAYEVIQAARAGDVLATEVIRDAGMNLGLAVVSLIHIFDPEAVIIGGGVSNAGDLLLDPIRSVVAERAMPDFLDRAKVVRSALGDDSGILGAVAFAMDKLAFDI